MVPYNCLSGIIRLLCFRIENPPYLPFGERAQRLPEGQNYLLVIGEKIPAKSLRLNAFDNDTT